MQIAYNLQTGIVVTKSGPCGMHMIKHTCTTLIFEDAFGKCEVVITVAPGPALTTQVVIMRVFIAGGMELHTIDVQHSPRMQANPIQEICDKINEIIADF